MVVNGRSYYGIGPRKLEAKNAAARNAMSSLKIEDQNQLKNQPRNIKEKIDELKRIKADLKCRLKSLKAQSKSKKKASQDLVLKKDKPKEKGTKKRSFRWNIRKQQL